MNSPQNELVSIVMPAFNAERFIDAAIQSVVAQTYPTWELLIVNDCSTDATAARIAQHAANEHRIVALSHEVNQGVVQARNSALNQAKGRYIAFLDSDDLWEPNKLAAQLAFMQQTGTTICYSAYQRISEAGQRLNTVVPPTSVTYSDLLKGNVIGNLTGIYDTHALGKEELRKFRHEDYVAWLGLIKRAGTARGLEQVLGSYRVSQGSVSSNKLRVLGWQWRIYRASEGLSIAHSTWLMLNYAFRAAAKRTNWSR